MTRDGNEKPSVGEPLIDTERLERLIAALETAANAIMRLVQALERKKKPAEVRAPRARPAVLERTIKATPLINAAVNRALARLPK